MDSIHRYSCRRLSHIRGKSCSSVNTDLIRASGGELLGNLENDTESATMLITPASDEMISQSEAWADPINQCVQDSIGALLGSDRPWFRCCWKGTLTAVQYTGRTKLST